MFGVIYDIRGHHLNETFDLGSSVCLTSVCVSLDRLSCRSALWPWYLSTPDAASCVCSRGPVGGFPIPPVLSSVQPTAVWPAAGHPGHGTLHWTGNNPLISSFFQGPEKDSYNFSIWRSSSMDNTFALFSQVQPMYSMLQGGARMLGQGGGPHPQALGPPGGPQFPSQGDASQGPQQGIYGKANISYYIPLRLFCF